MRLSKKIFPVHINGVLVFEKCSILTVTRLKNLIEFEFNMNSNPLTTWQNWTTRVTGGLFLWVLMLHWIAVMIFSLPLLVQMHICVSSSNFLDMLISNFTIYNLLLFMESHACWKSTKIRWIPWLNFHSFQIFDLSSTTTTKSALIIADSIFLISRYSSIISKLFSASYI